MPTIFIDTTVVNLPYREQPGEPMTELHAAILDEVLHRRVKARLRAMLSKGEILAIELQTKAEELCRMKLAPYATLDDGDDSDPVLLEALEMAREIIIQRMAEEGLPPPKGIDNHAKALVDALPEIQEKARLRVEARFRAAAEVISS